MYYLHKVISKKLLKTQESNLKWSGYDKKKIEEKLVSHNF